MLMLMHADLRTDDAAQGDAHALGAALIAAWNAHDARKVASFFADDYLGEDVALASRLHGPRDVRKLVLLNALGIPDLHFEVEHSIAERDALVLIWVMRGTHQGRAFNIPATGQRIETRGVTWLRLRNGKVIRSLRIWDQAGMLRQFGLLPDAMALPD
jgi:steroid delta-isomerase-like uncharacterized protein